MERTENIIILPAGVPGHIIPDLRQPFPPRADARIDHPVTSFVIPEFNSVYSGPVLGAAEQVFEQIRALTRFKEIMGCKGFSELPRQILNDLRAIIETWIASREKIKRACEGVLKNSVSSEDFVRFQEARSKVFPAFTNGSEIGQSIVTAQMDKQQPPSLGLMTFATSISGDCSHQEEFFIDGEGIRMRTATATSQGSVGFRVTEPYPLHPIITGAELGGMDAKGKRLVRLEENKLSVPVEGKRDFRDRVLNKPEKRSELEVPLERSVADYALQLVSAFRREVEEAVGDWGRR